MAVGRRLAVVSRPPRQQRPDTRPAMTAPDGRTYRRRTTRIERGEAEALADSGCPVVTYLPGGRVVWHH
jgi:hypothetical protein